jgi:hypothetical protein
MRCSLTESGSLACSTARRAARASFHQVYGGAAGLGETVDDGLQLGVELSQLPGGLAPSPPGAPAFRDVGEEGIIAERRTFALRRCMTCGHRWKKVVEEGPI